MTGPIPIAPDPRWPAARQTAFETAQGEYVSVLLTDEPPADPAARLILETRLTEHDLVSYQIAVRDGSDYTTLDGDPIAPKAGATTRVIGVVLWEIRYCGP